MPLREDIDKVLVIGSGPIIIGQAAEFDYAGTQACLALKEEQIEVVLVNSNPATIMTDQTVADQVYIEPLTTTSIEKIIAKERPDGVMGTLGGQTGLNLVVELQESGILEKYNVAILGSSVDAIQKGEDREKFRQLMVDIGEPISESRIVHSEEEGKSFTEQIGYPVILRPAYTLGGEGGGFAHNEQELETLLKKALQLSPIHQVLIEKSIKGWKEVEYEVMRDANDTCIIVCNMENMDAVGVHTGDSIVVAPSQTLTDAEHQMLRNASLKVIRALDIIGGCNIQFALHPQSEQYVIIEVNPRVSRSSALASKATGYPIARMAAKCAVGYHLDELLNPITGYTYASFEPALDYVVVKLPRFPFDKFVEANRTLGTQMKATGEVMAIDRSFEGALNKGIRSLEMNVHGLGWPAFRKLSAEELVPYLCEPNDLRLFAIAEALRKEVTVEDIHHYTHIDLWYLYKIQSMIELENKLRTYAWPDVPFAELYKAKQYNMGDAYLAELFQVPEKSVRRYRKERGINPGYKSVDTCAAEFDAETPYFYSTWRGEDEVEVDDREKVLVIGSGPIRIGQGIEFDYCSVHAALAVQKKGYQAVVMNNNPETVSTDYAVADRLYFEPLAVEDILHVIEKEQIAHVLIQFGGQTALNVAQELEEEGIHLLGTSLSSVDALEDRQQFYESLQKLDIPHISGQTVHSAGELKQVAQKIGYPVLVRPSYVIGGQSMFVLHHQEELETYLQQQQDTRHERMWPLLVDAYLPGLECEVDVISDGRDILIPGIFEHVERAGVHSGDSTAVFPPLTLREETKTTLVDYARRLAEDLQVVGLMNIQFVIQEGTVYVLEVNPRASRTVPIMSKVTGISMVEWATRIQLGDTLCHLLTEAGMDEQLVRNGLLPEPPFYAVKVPVFSNSKLQDVDDALGPEMKSTGEQLGIGLSVQEALHKALFSAQVHPLTTRVSVAKEHEDHLQGKTAPFVLCSFADDVKQEGTAQVIALLEKGYNVLATPGTAHHLRQKDVEVKTVEKHLPAIESLFKEGHIQAVLNVASQGRSKTKFGFGLRALARKYRIPCFTSLDTVQLIMDLPQEIKWDVQTIDQVQGLESTRVESLTKGTGEHCPDRMESEGGEEDVSSRETAVKGCHA